MVLQEVRRTLSGKPVRSSFLTVTGDVVSSRRDRKRIMAILRLATRVLGIGQKARIGRLGSASIAALIAGLGFAGTTFGGARPGDC